MVCVVDAYFGGTETERDHVEDSLVLSDDEGIKDTSSVGVKAMVSTGAAVDSWCSWAWTLTGSTSCR